MKFQLGDLKIEIDETSYSICDKTGTLCGTERDVESCMRAVARYLYWDTSISCLPVSKSKIEYLEHETRINLITGLIRVLWYTV